MITNNDKNINSFNKVIDIRKNKKYQSVDFVRKLNETKLTLGISENYIKLIKDCGNFLEYISDLNFEHSKLTRANFCKHRFCPHCSYNKARKDAMELSILTEYLKSKDYQFIFLTLTAPNVTGNLLEQELKNYADSFRLLFKRKEVKQINKGYVRKVEITYNLQKNTYHAHYHILIAVNKSYFTDKRYYLSQNKWLNLWRECKNDFSITQVDVRKFKDNSDKAIFELTKYIAKDSNYLYSDEVFTFFYKALKSKKSYSFNGVFKTAKILYKNGELDYLKQKDNVIYFYKLWFIWNKLKYDNIENSLLTSEELEKYNTKYIDEVELD